MSVLGVSTYIHMCTCILICGLHMYVICTFVCILHVGTSLNFKNRVVSSCKDSVVVVLHIQNSIILIQTTDFS